MHISDVYIVVYQGLLLHLLILEVFSPSVLPNLKTAKVAVNSKLGIQGLLITNLSKNEFVFKIFKELATLILHKITWPVLASSINILETWKRYFLSRKLVGN